MNKYRAEGWVKKIRGTYPMAYSTSYDDYGAHAKPAIPGWMAKEGGKTTQSSQASSVDRLARPRKPEDHDDLRLLHYPNYYQQQPLADLPKPPRKGPGYSRRRAHPGVRLPPMEDDGEVAPVHYPSHNHHIRNHLAQQGECLCKFPARPYKDIGAGDPRYLHPVTGRSYKGAPLTWCHFKPPSNSKPKPTVNNKLFNTTFLNPWQHSYVPAKIN